MNCINFYKNLLYKINEKEALYLVNSKVVEPHIYPWKHNRPVDNERVLKISEYIMQSGIVDGIIYVANIIEEFGNILYCFDGLHRLNALKKLDFNYKILLYVLDGVTHEYVKDKFVALNQCAPVADIYLLNNNNHIDNIKAIVHNIIKFLESQFPNHMSNSRNCRKPNFNSNILFNELCNHLLEKELYNIEYKDLLNNIMKLNITYKLNNDLHKKLKLNNSVLSKCKKNNCYLFIKNFIEDLEI
jgi:hypothetical protein